MKKNKVLLSVGVLGLSAVLLAVTPMTRVNADNQTDLQEAQKEKESLEKDLKEAQELIDSLKNSKSDVKQDVDQEVKRYFGESRRTGKTIKGKTAGNRRYGDRTRECKRTGKYPV